MNRMKKKVTLNGFFKKKFRQDFQYQKNLLSHCNVMRCHLETSKS